MSQPILKRGHLVKYHAKREELDASGFELGQIYEVVPLFNDMQDVLGVRSPNGQFVMLLFDNSRLGEFADHFSIHNCPIVLPRGKVV